MQGLVELISAGEILFVRYHLCSSIFTADSFLYVFGCNRSLATTSDVANVKQSIASTEFLASINCK